MSHARLPAHLEVTGLIRAAEAAGAFATVLSKGERDAGTLMVVCCHMGTNAVAFERFPQADGSRKWTVSKKQEADNTLEFIEFCQRRSRQDGDLWIVEIDHEAAEDILNNFADVN